MLKMAARPKSIKISIYHAYEEYSIFDNEWVNMIKEFIDYNSDIKIFIQYGPLAGNISNYEKRKRI